MKEIQNTQNEKIIKTVTFNETEVFFKHVEDNLKIRLEVTSLIFAYPEEIIQEVLTKFKSKKKVAKINF